MLKDTLKKEVNECKHCLQFVCKREIFIIRNNKNNIIYINVTLFDIYCNINNIQSIININNIFITSPCGSGKKYKQCCGK